MIYIFMNIDLFYDKEESSTKFKLLEPVIFTFNEEEMKIPVGFVSDGMSVPRGLWNIVEPLSGKYIKAALVHDYGYSIHYAPRKVIDQLLYDMLVEAGMSRAKAYAIFLAVRSFGRADIGNELYSNWTYPINKFGVSAGSRFLLILLL